MQAFIKQVRTNFQNPLPGQAAQYKMAHVVRHSYKPAPETATLASTLALFYPKKSEWHIVLIERVSSNPNDRHKGQISFPGGRFDDTDKDPSYTALRETYEEVGVAPDQVNLLGKLTDLYIPVSNFLVKPFVGFTEDTPKFIPQISEVKSILEIPLDLFLDKATIQKKDLKIANNITLRKVPYYNVYGKVVWGATAMMISELLEVINGSATH